MDANFGAQTTTDDLLVGRDLSGMRVLVTGVAAALGTETVRALTAHGAQVIGVDRDLDAARAATADMPGVTLLTEDPASLASVRALSDALRADRQPIDLVICTGGIVACPEGRSEDGHELQFAINHLAHFVLINRILPLLREGSRVVLVSSAGHRFGDIDLDDPNFERTPYNEWVSYGRSSTAKILFAQEFDRRYKAQGIRAASVHPGKVRTQLSSHVASTVTAMSEAQAAPEWKTIPQGAATAIWAGLVADPEEIGGRYCEDCHVADPVDDPDASGGVQVYALDPDRAKALWAKSEEMVGERF